MYVVLVIILLSIEIIVHNFNIYLNRMYVVLVIILLSIEIIVHNFNIYLNIRLDIE